MFRIALIAFLFISIVTPAQSDSSSEPTEIHTSVDTTHSPKRATILSAIVPGSGQIYNSIHRPKGSKSKLWWKLPLIYGGMGTTIYFAIDNHKYYSDFRQERIDRLKDPNHVTDYLNHTTDEALASSQAQFERWRDLNIIATLGIYVLNIVDANVEGHLLHFDTTNDLSFQFQPSVFQIQQSSFTGLSVSMRF